MSSSIIKVSAAVLALSILCRVGAAQAPVAPGVPASVPNATGQASAAGGTTETAAAADQALVERACTGCHELDRVTAAPRSEQDWLVVIDQMVGFGAAVDEDAKKRIAHYLGTRG